jgi:hypothetical protein
MRLVDPPRPVGHGPAEGVDASGSDARLDNERERDEDALSIVNFGR